MGRRSSSSAALDQSSSSLLGSDQDEQHNVDNQSEHRATMMHASKVHVQQHFYMSRITSLERAYPTHSSGHREHSWTQVHTLLRRD